MWGNWILVCWGGRWGSCPGGAWAGNSYYDLESASAVAAKEQSLFPDVVVTVVEVER